VVNVKKETKKVVSTMKRVNVMLVCLIVSAVLFTSYAVYEVSGGVDEGEFGVIDWEWFECAYEDFSTRRSLGHNIILEEIGIQISHGGATARDRAGRYYVYYPTWIEGVSDSVQFTNESFEMFWEIVYGSVLIHDRFAVMMKMCVVEALIEADLLDEWDYRTKNAIEQITGVRPQPRQPADRW